MENDFIWRLLHISLTTCVIIGLLLLLTPLLHKRYPSKWRYYIWLVITARLLIPFNISLPQATVNIPVLEIAMPVTVPAVTAQDNEPATAAQMDKKSPTVLSPSESITTSKQTEIIKEIEKPPTLPFSKLVGSIWLFGMIILFLIQAFAYITFLRKLHYRPRYETSSHIRDLLSKTAKELGVARLPQIRMCEAAPSPILTGLFRPVLLLPHVRYSDRELLFILRHELVHFRRHDLWYKLALTITKIIHWFNPFVWLMAAQAGRDVELSCDDLVMVGLSDDDRISYGNTILNALPIKSKWRLEPVLTTSFGSTKKNMKQRLKNLFDRSLKKKGAVAFCAVLLLTSFIGSAVAFTPALAAGNEKSSESPANTVFSNNDDGASRVMLGPYALKKQNSCTVTISWKEGGTQTLQFIKETQAGKENTARTEHKITSGTPLTVTAWEDGNYRFVIPAGKSMTGIVCVVDYTETNDSDKIIAGKEYVSYDQVELRTYEDGSPYIHDILSNHTKRDIVACEHGMLAFDKNGKPLKIKWNIDSEMIPAYYFLHDWGKENVPSGTTNDVYGGWSLNGGNPYNPDPAPEIVWQIEYVLYNLKTITFSDGTVWVNPDYENWLKTYEGKQISIDTLNKYYPYTMEINSDDIRPAISGQQDSSRIPATDIILTVENCNVAVRHSEDNDFHYEYDTSVYRVTRAEAGSLTNIHVEKISDTDRSVFPDIIEIYIPVRAYNNITVVGKKAGIGLPRLNANLDITNINGAISVCVPEGFDKTIDYTGFEGSGSIKVSPKAKDYVLQLDAHGSAVSVSDGFPAVTLNRMWEYKNGSGTAKINLSLEGCAFSINLNESADAWIR